MEILEVSADVQRGRDQWRYRGAKRPPFAEATGAGDESVWDFPRPPMVQAVAARVRVFDGEHCLADSQCAKRVAETAGAPTYYVRPADVVESLLTNLGPQSLCEWKGVATAYASPHVANAGWAYHQVFPEFQAICGWYAFYPGVLRCFLDTEQVTAQPGGFYGGWVTKNLKGPIKGATGSQHW